MAQAIPGQAHLDTLKGLLTAASKLARDLASDRFMERLLEVFAKFPAEDREAILGILEREAESKHLAATTADTTGVSLRPNPHARLYVRVIDPDPPPDPGADPDKIVLASVRSMRMLHRVIPPICDRWRSAMREAIGALDAEERAGVAWFTREMATLVDEVEGAER